jgi:hypothetical protein
MAMKGRMICRLAAWIMGIAGLMAAGVSSASSYALSTNSITNFLLSMPSGSTFGGFTFSGDIAVSLGDLTGGDIDIDKQDADAACVGGYCAGFDNSFSSHGVSPYPGYAYGDALISDKNVLAGTGAASSIGEATSYDGLAGAAGANTMIAVFSLVSAGALDFSFLSTPYMETQLGAGALAASGTTDMNIVIRQGGTKIFEWTPDGSSGGILNGTEGSDPFSLNFGINGIDSYSPGTGAFTASTAALAAGAYTMEIFMGNEAHVASVSAVPVPAALPLFGTGVVALAALARRRSKSSKQNTPE